ncbi:hypothetical protein VT84_14285 [Gemmata sp. SH-PL17]|uniref:hypothetical protein n=1 Tax=Gemmata sp. SH-PL17 TaxID=1630693 RepID=UPI00078D669D|nr:hypothetical protein [Gemmata sp. SH-PL17]AMV25562.1 hypothetical protein VT84_14285 [Gemmata sp. SH-PL17]
MVARVVLSDVGRDAVTGGDTEALVARLTRAAYEVALRYRPDRPFNELEFALWREIRTVLNAPEAT